MWDLRLKQEAREYIQESSGIPTGTSWQDLKDLAEDALKLQTEMHQDFLGTYSEEVGEGIDEEPSDAMEEEPSVSAYVETRARLISEFLAMLADQRADVTKFREEALGGRLLSADEARTMEAPGEVQEDLRKLGSALASDYLGWEEEEAIWYVVTGEAPRLRPIKITGRGKFRQEYVPFQARFTLTILPWVPAKEVGRVYRTIQQQWLKEKSRETGLRVFEVGAFVLERLRLEGDRDSWQAWFKQWNQIHPDKKFKTWRHFREYCARGQNKALPNYEFPASKPRPEMQAEIERFKERLKYYMSGSNQF